MPIYEYKCEQGHHTDVFEDQSDPDHQCELCNSPCTRVYSVSFNRPMPAHFNPTLGQYVTNESKFNDGLKQLSESATARTGITHDYQPTDPTDMKANGVTSEGLKETFDAAPPETRKILRKYIDSE